MKNLNLSTEIRLDGVFDVADSIVELYNTYSLYDVLRDAILPTITVIRSSYFRR